MGKTEGQRTGRALSEDGVGGSVVDGGAVSITKMTYLLSFPQIDPHLYKVGQSDFPPSRAAYYSRVFATECQIDIVLCHEMWERVVLGKFGHMRAIDHDWEITAPGRSEFLYDETGEVRRFLDSVRHLTHEECQQLSRRFWSSVLVAP